MELNLTEKHGETPQCHLDISRAGFIYRSTNLFKSLTRSMGEEKKIKVFKQEGEELGKA